MVHTYQLVYRVRGSLAPRQVKLQGEKMCRLRKQQLVIRVSLLFLPRGKKVISVSRHCLLDVEVCGVIVGVLCSILRCRTWYWLPLLQKKGWQFFLGSSVGVTFSAKYRYESKQPTAFNRFDGK